MRPVIRILISLILILPLFYFTPKNANAACSLIAESNWDYSYCSGGSYCEEGPDGSGFTTWFSYEAGANGSSCTYREYRCTGGDSPCSGNDNVTCTTTEANYYTEILTPESSAFTPQTWVIKYPYRIKPDRNPDDFDIDANGHSPVYFDPAGQWPVPPPGYFPTEDYFDAGAGTYGAYNWPIPDTPQPAYVLPDREYTFYEIGGSPILYDSIFRTQTSGTSWTLNNAFTAALPTATGGTSAVISPNPGYITVIGGSNSEATDMIDFEVEVNYISSITGDEVDLDYYHGSMQEGVKSNAIDIYRLPVVNCASRSIRDATEGCERFFLYEYHKDGYDPDLRVARGNYYGMEHTLIWMGSPFGGYDWYSGKYDNYFDDDGDMLTRYPRDVKNSYTPQRDPTVNGNIGKNEPSVEVSFPGTKFYREGVVYVPIDSMEPGVQADLTVKMHTLDGVCEVDSFTYTPDGGSGPPPPCTPITPSLTMNETTCLPHPDYANYNSTPIYTAYFNNGSSCQLDWLDISTNSSFPDANRYNVNVTGKTTQSIPQGFAYNGTPLQLQPHTTYFLRGYDSDTTTHTGSFQFITPGYCSPASTASITSAPQCKPRPLNEVGSSDPSYDLRLLKWNKPAQNNGGNIHHYNVQISTNSGTSGLVHNSGRVIFSDGRSVLSYSASGFYPELELQTPYYYRVRSNNKGGYSAWSPWYGPRSFIEKPTAPLNFTGTANNSTNSIYLDWDYNNTSRPVNQWTGSRTGGAVSGTVTAPGSTTNYTDSAFVQCNNTTYNYTLSGSNVCGTGPTASTSVYCAANQAPSCGVIQYSENNGSTWANYPSGGLTRPVSTRIKLRRSCTDPESNPVTYSWSTSFGCGTFSPSTQTISGSSTTSVTDYTFSSTYSASCDLTSSAKDSLDNAAPNRYAVANTLSQPTVGTQTLQIGSRSIQRSVESNTYAVINGQTQNVATLVYRITGYNNPTVSGGTNPGTLTINTASRTLGGSPNICHSDYGTCTFASSGNTTVNNITAANSNHTINVIFKSTHVDDIKNPFTSSGADKYMVRVRFSATTAENNTITTNRTASPAIVDNFPFCESLSMNPGVSNGGNVTIGIAGRDDWSLRGLNVRYARVGTSTYTNIYNNADLFNNTNPTRYGTHTINNWNTSSLADGRYYIRADMTDFNGNQISCLADRATGVENPGDSSSFPIYRIDKTAPTCGGSGLTITRSGNNLLFDVDGVDPIVNSSYSGLERLDITYVGPNSSSGTAIVDTDMNPDNNTPPIQSYSFPHSTDNNAYSLNNLDGGLYTFTATWTDAAGNTGSCSADYEKGSRISGRVIFNVGTNGNEPRDFRYEHNGTQFNITSGTNPASLTDSANWRQNSGSNADCSVTYPGVAGNNNCNAFFVTQTEFTAGVDKYIRLTFPVLPGTTTGKYRCTMDVQNNISGSYQLIDSQTRGSLGAQGSSGLGECTFHLPPNTAFVHGNTGDNLNTVWPTHIRFWVDYNAGQVNGQIRDENGNLDTSSYTINVSNSSGASGVSSGGTYSSPSGGANDNSVNYARVGASTSPATSVNVSVASADPERLCVWTYRNDFTNNNDARNSFDTLFSSNAVGRVRDIAQNQTLSGWGVETSGSCQITRTLAPTSTSSTDNMAPKLQNQLNILNLPKVKITGDIYLLPDDNLCGNPGDWATEDVSGEPGYSDVDFNIDLTTSSTGNGLNSSTSGYTTGSSYDIFIDGLPTSGFDTWTYNRSISFTGADAYLYTACPNNTIDVGNTLSNYPQEFEIQNDIAVYVKETNDWFQAYNGGVHADMNISNAIPTEEMPVEADTGNILRAIVGNPTYTNVYTNVYSIDQGSFGYYTGGLVTAQNLEDIGVASGIDSEAKDWSYFSDKIAPIRVPFAANSPDDDLTVINRVENSTGTSTWNTNVNNGSFRGSSDHKYLYSNGDFNYTVNGDYRGNTYMVVNGNLTIDENIRPDGSDYTKPLFFVVNGNVTIASDVTEVSAFIYAKGDIEIQSAGTDSAAEQLLKVYGGLYASGDITFGRDLQNDISKFGYPSEQVIFNPALIINSNSDDQFPQELKETNVYWIQDQ